MTSAKTEASRTLTGIALATCGWAAFSAQDAIVKWLVVKLPVAEVLFARSVMIVALASFVVRRADLRSMMQRRNLAAVAVRGLLILAAWLAYYSASRSLQLAELVTLYFAAPLFVVAMSNPILGEIVGPWRWMTTLIGFGGVLIAADLSAAPDVWPALLTLFGALCWAGTTILARSLSQAVSTAALMVGSNFLFVVACGFAAPFVFVWPDAFSFGLIVALGLVGSVGQFFLFEGLRRAPASALAPFEYTSLAWAILWGWLVFNDLPPRHVLIGAAIILCSGLFMLLIESRRHVLAARA
ncbi:DMT family transporter [Methylocapsa sp. S129]|uniref:DMT family transporter n=1 Tax=Methylocapsa sp. S129 TaxID=1641869 RepID=UPI00131BD35E|nr:DMT family transporter [Methylocapsa sp. S129]